MRDATRDVSIYRGPMPEATSFALAAQLMGKVTTPSHAAIRAESKLQIQDALNTMDAIDREVLTLRHFEMLSNAETAQVLELSHAAASNRYVRALKRMKKILEEARGEKG
jgi:RNA polymerase sigma-70 factor (ECF subfamily)